MKRLHEHVHVSFRIFKPPSFFHQKPLTKLHAFVELPPPYSLSICFSRSCESCLPPRIRKVRIILGYENVLSYAHYERGKFVQGDLIDPIPFANGTQITVHFPNSLCIMFAFFFLYLRAQVTTSVKTFFTDI